MGIVVIGDVFIDIKGFSTSPYIPYGRNAGTIAQIHGGVGRNVAEDIANVELEPTFVSSVDDDAMGEDVIRKLDRHKVNTKYMKKVKNGMGTWLAVFDHEGDVVASISKRPDHKPIEQILDEHGDEIFKDADSIVIEIDIDREIVKKTFHYAEKYKKKVYAIVSNMTIAIERRDFIRRIECPWLARIFVLSSLNEYLCLLSVLTISSRISILNICVLETPLINSSTSAHPY